MSIRPLFKALTILSLLAVLWPLKVVGLEKVRIGASPRVYYPNNLLLLAAEEREFWKEAGLQAEWVPFGNAMALDQAIAAGHVEIGLQSAITAIQAAAGGAPILIVAHVVTKGVGFYIWVRPDSPIKEGTGLKGTRIGVLALGSTNPHILGQVVTKALRLEKDVKFIGTGSPEANVAALRAGHVDAVIQALGAVANLLVRGEVRMLLNTADYLPKDWVESTVVVNRDFLDKNLDTVRKLARAFLSASKFLKENRGWATEKLKSPDLGLSEKAADIVYDNMIATIEFGKIDKAGVENVRNFMIEYGLLPKEKVPTLEAIYRNIF